MPTTAYLAAPGYVEQLRTELGHVDEDHGRLLLVRRPAVPAAWAANVWYDAQRIDVPSIGAGANALRAMQRNWVHFPVSHHRRAALLAARLPHVAARPLAFPDPPLRAPLGSWTLLEAGTMLAAPRCRSVFPHGEATFVEDREAPPNRAYLKLWEALTLVDARPGPGSVCVDLGSSPGGWTWVLQRLGAVVVSVDKAPLDPTVANLPGVEFRQESAFGLDPAGLGSVDWMFCDVACYPERLLRLVRTWLEAGTCPRLVCTIKFQGATDHGVTAAFAALPGATVQHLHHNKHELTLFCGVAPVTPRAAPPATER